MRFAEIVDGVCTNVIFADHEFVKNQEGLGSVYVLLSEDNVGHHGVGAGHKYDEKTKQFSPPDPVVEPRAIPTEKEQYDAALNVALKNFMMTETKKQIQSGSLSESEIQKLVDLFPEWSPEKINHKKGAFVKYAGGLYEVTKEHTASKTSQPDVSVNNFKAHLKARDSKAYIAPEASAKGFEGYMRNQRVTLNGKTYLSLIDYNTFELNTEYWKIIDE